MFLHSSMSVPVPDTDLTSFLLDGISEDVPPQTRHLLTDPFLFSAEHSGSTHLSLIQFKHLVKCFAAGLRHAGMQPGDHAMLIAPNYIHAIVICLGVIAAGGVFCTSQPDFKVREYVDQLRRDEPRFLFVCDEEPLRKNVLTAWEGIDGNSGNIWLFDEELVGGKKQWQEGNPLPHWSELIDEERGPTFQWDRLTTREQCQKPCQLFYTSGTTGLRKAALISHRNLVAAFTAVGYRVQQDVGKLMRQRGAATVPNSTRKLLHTISIARGFGTSLPLSFVKTRQRSSVELYFMSKTWIDMIPYLSRIQALGITDLSVAPFTLNRLFAGAKDPSLVPAGGYDFSCLQSITVTGAPCAQRSLDLARNFLLDHNAPATVRVERAFAITEAGSIVTNWHLSDPPDAREGCQGRLEPNMEAKIMSYGEGEEYSARELDPGEHGELWLRSPSCIAAYYRNDEATAEAFRGDGWYRTGDIGFFKDEKLFLVDRKKDILKTPDNIPPTYIESVLMEHADIVDVGVVGVYEPSREYQLVRAYVVKHASATVSEADVTAWMQRESAATAHLTGGVVFVEELPRNSMGKLLRSVLQERAMLELHRHSVSGMTLAQEGEVQA